MSEAEEATELLTGATSNEGPPSFDAAAVGRVARIAELRDIELLALYFTQASLDPLLTGAGERDATVTPEVMGIGVQWAYRSETGELGCAIDFSFDGDAESDPSLSFELSARFRLVFQLNAEGPVPEADLQQFTHWNAVYNGWSYWRQLVSDLVGRTNLPKAMVPLLGVPRSE